MTAVVFFFSSFAARANEPGSEVRFTELRPFNSKSDPGWGKTLTDIVNHEAPGDSNPYEDKVTKAHETSHGIHSYIRNNMNTSGKRTNGFYVLQNRAVLIEEPRMRKSQIGPFVPASLRGPRYSTYVTGQIAWDDTPLYVWDEWNAYVNGGDTGVDLVLSGLWKGGWRDAVAGQIEFNVYALATAMAVKTHDPQYFSSHHQFTEFLAFNLKRSMTSFSLGAAMPQFAWDEQDRYYKKIKSSPDAESLREFARDLFGSGWVYETLGF
jgi:hypothetical protein